MGKLSNRKRRARFETDATVFSRGVRPVVLELRPGHLLVGAKGLRTFYLVTYEELHDFAMKRAMLAAARERKLAKRWTCGRTRPAGGGK